MESGRQLGITWLTGLVAGERTAEDSGYEVVPAWLGGTWFGYGRGMVKGEVEGQAARDTLGTGCNRSKCKGIFKHRCVFFSFQFHVLNTPHPTPSSICVVCLRHSMGVSGD